MTQKSINLGTADKGNGDPLRVAFGKVNDNFTELYTALGLIDNSLNLGAFEFADSVMTTTDSSAIVIDQAVTVSSNLSVGGDIVPQTALGGDLGSSTLPWRSLYVSNNTIYIGGTAVGLDANGNLTTGGTVVGSTPAWTNITGKPTFATVATTGAYADLTGKPTIPTLVSQLSNDSGFLTSVSNIQSESDVSIQVNLTDSTTRIWRFGEDGSLTLPIGVSIDNNVDPLYPRIIADSGKAFSVQGQGASGSAAMAWSVDPNSAGQYAAVGVTKEGGDNLAKVVLQAQSNSGDGATVKLWKFDETGALTIPGDIRSEGNINIEINLSDSTLRRWQFGEDGYLTLPQGGNISEGGGFTGAIKLTPAGGANAYQALMIYPTAGGEGDHIHLTAGGGTTELYLGDDTHYVKLGKGAGYNGTIIITATGRPNIASGIISQSGNWAAVSLSNLATTGGTGTGLTVTVTQVAGVAAAIAIVSGAMEGYTSGDTITVTSGAATATFIIGVLAPEWVFAPDGDLYIPSGNTIRKIGGEDIRSIPGPYADDAAAAAASVAVGYPYHKTGTGGQVFVRLT